MPRLSRGWPGTSRKGCGHTVDIEIGVIKGVPDKQSLSEIKDLTIALMF